MVRDILYNLSKKNRAVIIDSGGTRSLGTALSEAIQNRGFVVSLKNL